MALGFGSRRGGNLVGGLSGVAAGATLMWFLDPRRGAARRADVGQRAGRAVREAEGLVESGARDLSHRTAGLVAEARARLRPEHADDEVIAERVRSRLGRLTSHPRSIEVSARGGEIALAGHVLEAEAARVVAGARAVRGVHGVEDRLERHATADVPDLQGAAHAPGPRAELFQATWSPGARLAGVTAGSILLGRALFGSGLLRPVYGVLGGGLLARAIANAPVREVAARAERGAQAKIEGARAKVEEVKSPAEGPAAAGTRREGRREEDRAGEPERRGLGEPPEGGWKMAGADAPGAVREPLAGSVHAEPPLGPPGRDATTAGIEPGPSWNEPAFPSSGPSAGARDVGGDAGEPREGAAREEPDDEET